MKSLSVRQFNVILFLLSNGKVGGTVDSCNIVVIDDEVRQCRSMKKIMEKLFPQITVEIFTDPVCALSYIERESIRIVITDICMPQMDGLTLVQKLMQSDPGRKVILLTGYAEFEYARKAIVVGAYDYLLKPMDPDKLKEVLNKCIRQVREESRSKQEVCRMHQRLDAAWPVYMENLLNQWLTGMLPSEEDEKIVQIFPRNTCGFLILTRFVIVDSCKKYFGGRELSQRKNSLGLWMREKIGPSYHSLSFFCSEGVETMATLVFPKNGLWDYPSWLESKTLSCSDIAEFAPEECKSVQMGVGIYVEDLNAEKQKAYRSAAKALEYVFYFPDSAICFEQSVSAAVGVQVRLEAAWEKELSDVLKGGNEEDVLGCMDAILDKCLSGGYPAPAQLAGEIARFLGHVADGMRYPEKFSGRKEGAEYLSYDDFRQDIYGYLRQFSQEIKGRDKESKGEFARQIFDYVGRSYRENISLEDVAGQFHLAPAYCSRLIKETTGSNFTQLLIDARMKEAKALLGDTNLHIYEIAERIGYGDVKYFNRVFKASAGMTPQQFRRACRKERDVQKAWTERGNTQRASLDVQKAWTERGNE